MEADGNKSGTGDARPETPSGGIIGLELTDGRVFYIHRSSLVNAGGYFAACFGDNGIPAGESRTDDHGRSIYFVARDGKLFENHILPFIIQKIPGKLPPFAQDPELWRLLRNEALFYGMDDLSELLRVTYSCSPDAGTRGKGVLYWLGTNKGITDYKNPYTRGAIDVTVGGLTDATYDQRREMFNGVEDIVNPRAFTSESRQALVQYRPPVTGKDEEGDVFHLSSLHACYSLWCNMSTCKFPTVVNLLSVKLRPSAYSLRQDELGMTDWNLEGSKDGSTWIILHKARNDRNIAMPDDSLMEQLGVDLDRCSTVAVREEISLEFAERERRGTWQLSPSSDEFYQYFRIIGSGMDYERSETSLVCLHGIGLELYGDIHEE